MLELKAQGWVASVPGRIGGFVLAVRPEELTMGQVVRHFDGVLAPIGCVATTDYEPCTQEPVCRFRRVLLDIRNYTVRRMDRATLAAVSAGAPVQTSEVFAGEFVDGGGI